MSRGNIFDILPIMGEAASALMVMMILFYVFAQFSGTDIDTRDIIDKGKTTMKLANVVVVGIIAVFSIVSIIWAYQVGFNPAYLPLFVLMLPALVIVAVTVANFVTEFTESSAMASVTPEFATGITTIQNLPTIIVVVVAIMVILMLRFRGGGR